MRYVTLGDTFHFKFTTRDFDTGAPQTLGGTPVISAYEDDNLTQITAGITLTASFDSVTGLNHVEVVATGGNGYEAGKYYAFVITTGTVDTVSVVGETVHECVIGPVDANVTEFGGTAGTFSAGRPEVNTSHVSGTVQTAGDIPDLVTTVDTVVDTLNTNLGTPSNFGSGTSTIAANLQDIADDGTEVYNRSTDSLQAIKDFVTGNILPAKNTAFSNLEFLFVAASDHVTPVTGASGTAVTRSIDGGAFGAGTGTLAEVSNGIYQYDASAADMNGDIITFRFTASGGTPGAPDDCFVTVKTSG